MLWHLVLLTPRGVWFVVLVAGLVLLWLVPACFFFVDSSFGLVIDFCVLCAVFIFLHFDDFCCFFGFFCFSMLFDALL